MISLGITSKCKSCGKKIVIEWHQIHGMRLLEEIDGKQCYRARCPECWHEWYVKKR